MKIKYAFLDGTVTEVEVSDEIGAVIIDSRKAEHAQDERHRYHCYSYTQEVKIDKRGIEVSNSASSQRTVITNTEFAGYYNDEVIFTLNKDETQTKKTTVDGELTVGKTKFVPMPTASEGLNIVILD